MNNEKDKVELRKVEDGDHTQVFRVPTPTKKAPSKANVKESKETPQNNLAPQPQYLMQPIQGDIKRKQKVNDPYSTEQFSVISGNPAYRDPSLTTQFGVPQSQQVHKFIQQPTFQANATSGMPSNKIVDKEISDKKFGRNSTKGKKKFWMITGLSIGTVILITLTIVTIVMFANKGF